MLEGQHKRRIGLAYSYILLLVGTNKNIYRIDCIGQIQFSLGTALQLHRFDFRLEYYNYIDRRVECFLHSLFIKSNTLLIIMF
jgi:hypothetical protein